MHDKVTFHFTRSGLHTTIQDLGRLGYQDIGIPVNGAMDKTAAKAANWLVGNNENNGVLEITMIGPAIQVEGIGQIAITGANLSPMINGVAAPMYQTIIIESGDEISFGRPVSGCRAYLAIAGSWSVKPWLGSVSASASKAAELTPHSVVGKGSVLEVRCDDLIPERSIPESERPDLSQLKDIHILPGPEFSLISNTCIGDFFSRDFIISNDSNRMGYKLDGRLKAFSNAQEVISSGIIPGTIQITNDGQPIILLADAQTSGGYTRLANVVTQDLDKLAQMKPGDAVRFRLVGLD